MPKRLWSYLIATASYALLLKLAALLLPDPRVLFGAANQPGVWSRQTGFHVSWFGALLVGVLMAFVLAGIRAWLTQRISGIGFNWPTLAGGFLSVLLVLVVASGLLGHNIFFIHGLLGWLVTPLLVWLGAFSYERFDDQLVAYAQQTTRSLQTRISTLWRYFRPA